jgi:hypothetical protein
MLPKILKPAAPTGRRRKPREEAAKFKFKV